MIDIIKKFGKRLQEIRLAHNLTQSKLAELVGLETMTISRIENGSQYPKPENIEKFAKVLKVDTREFFDFGTSNKKDLIEKLCSVIKSSSLADLQFYNKVIFSHIEYNNHNKIRKSKASDITNNML